MPVERIKITDRESWLAMRRQDVTASAVGALLGVHPYITPLQLFLEKTGQALPVEETEAMLRGTLLEPVAAELVRQRHPDWKVTYPYGEYLRDPELRIGATPDIGIVDEQGRKGLVQVKSVEASIFRAKWKGEDGEIEPPLYAAAQVIVEAYLAGAEIAYVGPLVVGHGLDMPLIEVPIHAGLLGRVKEATAKFWALVAKGEMPPADYARDGEALMRLYAADNGREIDLSADNHLPVILAEDETLAEEIKVRSERRKEIKAEIIAKLGEHSAARVQGWTVTAKTITRKSYSVAATSYRDVRKKRLREAGVAA